MTRRYFTLLTTALALSFGMASAAQAHDQRDDAQQPPIQARPGGPEGAPKTDQTIDVVKGTRLVLTNNAGEVVVRSWDKDQVRIEATHSARESVDAQTADMTLRVRTRSLRGPSGLVDYRVTVPKWMAVNLSGTYLDSTIEGTTAEVTVETVHGNARVTGGSGSVSVKSIEGIITIDKASGRVQATTVNEGIRVTNVTGEITAETTNGDIVIDNAQSSNLEASTVNGDVTFNGSIRDNGVYRLTTHGGDIRLGLGGVTNATVFVRTFQGDFTSDFPIQLPEGQSMRSGSKRFNFTLGSGSARIEVQSFNGDIVMARKAVVSKEEERDRRRGVRTPMAAPPAPPAPPAPTPMPAPAPKPPKPPGWHDGDWDAFAQDLVEDLGHDLGDLGASIGIGIGQGIGAGIGHGIGSSFEKNFQKDFEKNFEKDFKLDFDFDFEKSFDKDFEKNFEKQFKEIEKSLKSLAPLAPLARPRG